MHTLAAKSKPILVSLVVLLFCSVAFDSVQADGPIRRFFRGPRTTAAPTGYVCENGVCQPSTAIVRYSAASTVVASQPVARVATSAPDTVSVQFSAMDITEASARSFHGTLMAAAVKAQKAGAISRRDLVRLRVAMFSPAFRAHAEDLALVQVTASGEDIPFSISEDGTIERTSIDWEKLLAFLEKLVPIILMLLKAFGV